MLPRRPGLLLCAAMLAACAHAPAPRRGEAPSDRLVLVLSIDGLPAYLLRDPRLPAPTLRRLMREGAVAEGMQTVNPTVTWPNHTTLATGLSARRHGVLFNGRLLRPGPRLPVKVEQRDRADLVAATTVYDRAHAAGLRTAQIDWIPHQVGGTITWAFPEVPAVGGEVERELVAGGMLAERDVAEFRSSPITWRDEMWTGAAAYLIARRRPNLIFFHLLNLDASHHRYGPRSLAGMSTVALMDARLRETLDAIADAGLLGRATVIVVSDHGFKEVRHQIRPNAALRAAGLVEGTGAAVTCDAWVVPEGGTAMVYVTNPERRAEITARAREVLSAVDGIARVVEPGEFAALGLPQPEDNDQMADLVLVARPGYAFAGAHEGEAVVSHPEGVVTGTHGYLAEDPDMNAVFVAWGWGIRPGARLGVVRSVDVAPTVAALLGLELPDTEGRVLAEILEK